MIGVSDFKRIDIGIGEIVAAEPIPGTARLLKVQVNLGPEQRMLMAGLAHASTPHELIGLKVIVVANLEPSTIRGVLSQGMLLGAGCCDEQNIALLTITKQVANGTPVQ